MAAFVPKELLSALAALTLSLSAANASVAEAGPPQSIAADRQDLEATAADFQSRRFDGLVGHIEQLKRIVADAPIPYLASFEADGVRYDLVAQASDCLIASATFIIAQKKAAVKAKREECLREPYTGAALYLGSYYNETGHPDLALPALDTGLRVNPEDPILLSEKGAALISLHRMADALAVYNQGMALDSASPLERARFLRGRGFCLEDLNRLDEAEKAYRDSLVLEPGHGGALNELRYIAGLRAGQAPQAGGLYTSDKYSSGPAKPADH